MEKKTITLKIEGVGSIIGTASAAILNPRIYSQVMDYKQKEYEQAKEYERGMNEIDELPKITAEKLEEYGNKIANLVQNPEEHRYGFRFVDLAESAASDCKAYLCNGHAKNLFNSRIVTYRGDPTVFTPQSLYVCKGIIEALNLAPEGSRALCLLEYWGSITEHKQGTAHVYTCKHAKVMMLSYVDDIMHNFAIHCAHRAIYLAGLAGDIKLKEALFNKRLWMEKKLPREKLNYAVSKIQSPRGITHPIEKPAIEAIIEACGTVFYEAALKAFINTCLTAGAAAQKKVLDKAHSKNPEKLHAAAKVAYMRAFDRESMELQAHLLKELAERGFVFPENKEEVTNND